PDGRRFAATRDWNDGRSDVVVVTMRSGRARVVPHARAGDLYCWLDDRTVLLMRGSFKQGFRWEGYRLDGSRHRVNPGVDASTVTRLVLELSPDHRSAAGVECGSCPFIVLHGGVPRIVWKGHMAISQAWSPDSQWVAFSVPRGGRTQKGTWIV